MEKKKTTNRGHRSAVTPLIIRFIDNHLKSGEINAAEAMRQAGYKTGGKNGTCRASAASYATEVLRKPEVKRYLEKRRKELADAAEVTPEWVISFAKEYAEKNRNGIPIFDKNGEEIGRKSDSAAVIGALNIITKVCGLDKQTIEHSVSNGEGLGIIFHINGEKPPEEKK